MVERLAVFLGVSVEEMLTAEKSRDSAVGRAARVDAAGHRAKSEEGKSRRRRLRDYLHMETGAADDGTGGSVQLVGAGRNRRGDVTRLRLTIGTMRYHVLLVADDRPHPVPLAQIDAPDDDQARRFVAETWPGERLQIVRQDDHRLVWLSDGTMVWFPF